VPFLIKKIWEGSPKSVVAPQTQKGALKTEGGPLKDKGWKKLNKGEPGIKRKNRNSGTGKASLKAMWPKSKAKKARKKDCKSGEPIGGNCRPIQLGGTQGTQLNHLEHSIQEELLLLEKRRDKLLPTKRGLLGYYYLNIYRNSAGKM